MNHNKNASKSAARRVRLELEVDFSSGMYDVRFQNLSEPGADIDLTKLSTVVSRVLDNIATKSNAVAPAAPPHKLSLN